MEKKYKQSRVQSLEDRSRRPQRVRDKVVRNHRVEMQACQIRRKYPYFGKEKIKRILERGYGTNVEGIKGIIKHRENGYLCETDAASIKKALLDILNDKGLKERLPKSTIKTIIEHFSLESILKKEREIYKLL